VQRKRVGADLACGKQELHVASGAGHAVRLTAHRSRCAPHRLSITQHLTVR